MSYFLEAIKYFPKNIGVYLKYDEKLNLPIVCYNFSGKVPESLIL